MASCWVVDGIATGGALPTQPGVRPYRVVFLSPGGQNRPVVVQAGEQRLVQARRRPLKLSTKAFRVGLPGWMSCQSTCRSFDQRRIPVEVSSVPLPLTTQACRATRASSSRAVVDGPAHRAGNEACPPLTQPEGAPGRSDGCSHDAGRRDLFLR